MNKIYFDRRTDEWVKNLDIRYLAPEMYYEIKESEDDKQHHVFEMPNGVVEFSSENGNMDDFVDQYTKYLGDITYEHPIRKEWRIPTDAFKAGCKYYNIK